MKIIVNFTNDEKENIFKELRDADVMRSDIEKFKYEFDAINSIEKNYKGMKFSLINNKDHVGIAINIDSDLLSKITNLTKKFISKFFIIFKMIKELVIDCDTFTDSVNSDFETVGTKLNGYDVPAFFADMNYEKRKSHIMGELLNAVTSNSPIKDDVRNMAASLMDKDIDNFVINIDNKQKLQQNLNLIPSNDRS